ncbi:hypothetical protein PZ01_13660 [Lacticaseibacillus rhamnosus]|nr:hypothetical protein PZ01_13660 [Lacticaseibacillus rhamnosus]
MHPMLSVDQVSVHHARLIDHHQPADAPVQTDKDDRHWSVVLKQHTPNNRFGHLAVQQVCGCNIADIATDDGLLPMPAQQLRVIY